MSGIVKKGNDAIRRNGHAPAVQVLTPPVRYAYAQTVREILDEWGPWTCCMALMGVCNDGIPLAARFYDPKRASHYVFYGDTTDNLIRPVLWSMAAQEYGPEYWQYTIVSPENVAWPATTHMRGHVVSPWSRDAMYVIPSAAGLVEQRMIGRQRGPRHVVVLHDLGKYWRELGDDTHNTMTYVLRNGHKTGVNVLVTLRYEHKNRLPSVVRKLLRHKVYGAASNPIGAPVDVSSLAANEAMVKSDGRWLRYTAPLS